MKNMTKKKLNMGCECDEEVKNLAMKLVDYDYDS